MERVELLRKDGKTISFDAFVTNVFENQGGHWLLVAHQATPVSGRSNNHVSGDLLSTMRAPERSMAPARSMSASVR